MMQAIIQQPMYVSDKTYVGILTGMYKVTGGVVRHAHGKYKGRIVEHLKPADIQEANQLKKAAQQGARAGGKVLAEIKKADRRLLIVAGVAAITVTAGATVYYVVSGRESKDVRAFRKALASYVKAAEKGDICLKDIAELEKAVERLASRKDFNEICELLDAQGLPELASCLLQHTSQMTASNSNVIDFETARRLRSTGTPMRDLRNCLEVQRELFERVVA